MLDHVLALTFAVGFPLLNAPIYARRRPLLRANHSATRQREYKETIVWLGSMAIATLIVWRAAGRDLAVLGLAFEGSWQVLLSLFATIVGAGVLYLQVLQVRRDSTARQAARTALEPVREYLPVSEDEVRLFRVVSVAAGVGEELFYRGFLLWYSSQFMPVIWAVVVSTLLFGFAHLMFGTGATVRATITGAVLVGLFLFSGTLWASILLHTAIDLSSGEIGRAAFSDGSRAAA